MELLLDVALQKKVTSGGAWGSLSGNGHGSMVLWCNGYLSYDGQMRAIIVTVY